MKGESTALRKITALEVQKRNPRRVNVYLDGEFAFGCSRLVAAWLQVGQHLSDERIVELQTAEAREAAYQQALHFLSFRARSTAEIRRNLAQHAVPEEIIAETLERLQELNLVDDAQFARQWIENRSEFRPRSRRALAAELRVKGIDTNDIEPALDEVNDEEMAYRLALKQARKYRLLPWPEFRQKLGASLGRRGFPYGVAASVVRRVWDELHAQSTSE